MNMTSELESRLAGYQQELYNRVLNELNSGALHPAAMALAGAKKLLDSFIADRTVAHTPLIGRAATTSARSALAVALMKTLRIFNR